MPTNSLTDNQNDKIQPQSFGEEHRSKFLKMHQMEAMITSIAKTEGLFDSICRHSLLHQLALSVLYFLETVGFLKTVF